MIPKQLPGIGGPGHPVVVASVMSLISAPVSASYTNAWRSFAFGAPPPATHSRSHLSTNTPRAAFAPCAAAGTRIELSPVRPSPLRIAPFVVSPAQNVVAWPKIPSAAQGPFVFGLGGKSIRIGNGWAADEADTTTAAAASRPNAKVVQPRRDLIVTSFVAEATIRSASAEHGNRGAKPNQATSALCAGDVPHPSSLFATDQVASTAVPARRRSPAPRAPPVPGALREELSEQDVPERRLVERWGGGSALALQLVAGRAAPGTS